MIISALTNIYISRNWELIWDEYSWYPTFMTYNNLIAPLFFIAGYFSILFLLKDKRRIFYILLSLMVIYAIVFFFKRELFFILLYPLRGFFIWFTIGSLFRFFFDWFRKRNKVLELQKQNVRSNLAMLRMQINPHFLFNTINNIDQLIKEDPSKASHSLIKLSDIMRYMLYNNEVEKVEMKQELEYIDDYISLEQLRLKNELFLEIQKTGSPEDIKVAPMLFIPFVENAFKHSVDSNIEKGICMKFEFHEKKITFTCENKFEPNEAEKDAAHGIGLDTVSKRLKLLYPGNYRLDISKENKIFKVFLEIHTDEEN